MRCSCELASGKGSSGLLLRPPLLHVVLWVATMLLCEGMIRAALQHVSDSVSCLLLVLATVPGRGHLARVGNFPPCVGLLRRVQRPRVPERRLAVIPAHGHEEPVRDQAESMRIPSTRARPRHEHPESHGSFVSVTPGILKKLRTATENLQWLPVPAWALRVGEVEHMQVFRRQTRWADASLQLRQQNGVCNLLLTSVRSLPARCAPLTWITTMLPTAAAA